jgi:hypothetical protein
VTEPAYSYRAYGLSIRSDFPLSELEPANPQAAAAIRVLCGEKKSRAPRARVHVVGHDVYVSHPTVGMLRCRGGAEIEVNALRGVAEEVVADYVLSSGLAVLLHQRGFLVLHASAVMVHGQAVAFLGKSGSGKSTLAAAMTQQGHALIVDDILPVSIQGQVASVRAGVPRLKLWPDVLGHLGEDSEQLPRVWPDEDKRARRVPPLGRRAPVRLARVYVVEQGDELVIAGLAPQERLQALVQNTFTARLLRSIGAEAHFRQCVSLAEALPIRRLRRPLHLDQLGRAVRGIEAEIARR